MNAKLKIETQCPACGGTGLYCGLFEPKGFAVICRECNGTAKKVIEYLPFNGRVVRNEGVATVCWSKGMTSEVRKESEGIPYADFLAGKLPPISA